MSPSPLRKGKGCEDAGRFEVQEKIPTAKLARTCYFGPGTSRLFLTVPGQAGKDGPEIWVYRASP